MCGNKILFVVGGSMILTSSLTDVSAFSNNVVQSKLPNVRSLPGRKEIPTTRTRIHHYNPTDIATTSTSLSMANGFDLSKPTFDLFSLRTIRNDALLQYSSLNQSEPLRINIYLVLALSLFSFPTLSEAVIGEEAQLTSVVLSALGGLGSVALFVRECQNRLKQLTRIEKELNSESLQIKLPTKNKFDKSMYGNQPVLSLKNLKGKRRILAICGSNEQLKDSILSLRIFRRRLAQAGALVVIVPTDTGMGGAGVENGNGNAIDWDELGIKESEIRSGQWLAQIQGTETWIDYCKGLVNTEKEDDLVWFGFNYNGRSFASATGESPRLLEILGQNLRPVDFLDESDDAEPLLGLSPVDVSLVESVSQRQKDFYEALTNGNLENMNQICKSNKAQEVTEILDAGGRVDSWQSCLAAGARPADMKISGSDVVVISPTEAYSTCIEFPVNTGGYSDPSGATLLAVQQWSRVSESDEWTLALHQTIPWSPDTRAGGTLRCDARGCVALTRGEEKRTFGGLIG